MTVAVRKIKQEDNPAIRKVIRTVLEEHGVTMPGTAYHDDSLNNMFEFYTKPGSAYFVAEDENGIFGGSGIFPTEGLPKGTCELVKMYILSSHRGKGTGRKLMEACLDFAKQENYHQVYLETKLCCRKLFTCIKNSDLN